jgi:lipoprotein-anchoring transpeptidase ErfK/SrfK
MHRLISSTAIATATLVGATALAAMKPTLATSRPAAAPARLIADLSDKILYVYDAGSDEPDMYDIAHGRDSYPTPTGQFGIRKLTWNPSWNPPDSRWARKKAAAGPGDPKNPMKIVKIFFREPDYYIHGTDDVGSLGSADSHGCLRMAPEDVAKLGKWVMAHGGKPQGESWFQRILHSRREEKVVYLSSPVPLLIRQ